MEMVYRGLIAETGEILESEVFKNVYRCSLQNAKCAVDADMPCVVIELECAWYSDYCYVNRFGYLQRDIVNREHIAYIAVSDRGYTIDYLDGSLDVDRIGWKSVEKELEV